MQHCKCTMFRKMSPDDGESSAMHRSDFFNLCAYMHSTDPRGFLMAFSNGWPFYVRPKHGMTCSSLGDSFHIARAESRMPVVFSQQQVGNCFSFQDVLGLSTSLTVQARWLAFKLHSLRSTNLYWGPASTLEVFATAAGPLPKTERTDS